jgi:hypothetical protein
MYASLLEVGFGLGVVEASGAPHLVLLGQLVYHGSGDHPGGPQDHDLLVPQFVHRPPPP